MIVGFLLGTVHREAYVEFVQAHWLGMLLVLSLFPIVATGVAILLSLASKRSVKFFEELKRRNNENR